MRVFCYLQFGMSPFHLGECTPRLQQSPQQEVNSSLAGSRISSKEASLCTLCCLSQKKSVRSIIPGRRMCLISIMEAHETSGVISRHASVIKTVPVQTRSCLMFRFSVLCKMYVFSVWLFCECLFSGWDLIIWFRFMWDYCRKLKLYRMQKPSLLTCWPTF